MAHQISTCSFVLIVLVSVIIAEARLAPSPSSIFGAQTPNADIESAAPIGSPSSIHMTPLTSPAFSPESSIVPSTNSEKYDASSPAPAPSEESLYDSPNGSPIEGSSEVPKANNSDDQEE